MLRIEVLRAPSGHGHKAYHYKGPRWTASFADSFLALVEVITKNKSIYWAATTTARSCIGKPRAVRRTSENKGENPRREMDGTVTRVTHVESSQTLSVYVTFGMVTRTEKAVSDTLMEG
jgi:hypothetical protein